MRHFFCVEISVIIYGVVDAFSDSPGGLDRLRKFEVCMMRNLLHVEADYEYPFSVLRYVRVFVRTHHIVIYCVSQLFQGGFYHFECLAFVVGLQILDIFQEYGARPFPADDFSDIEKQCPSRVVESQPVPCYRECLAGETRA